MSANKWKKYALVIPIFLISFLNLRSARAQQQLNIISYNIRHGRDLSDSDQLKSIARLITKSKADIVGLEEVDSVCSRSGKVDQTDMLAKLTHMHRAYTRHFAFEGGSYGLALLSKFPITRVINKRLPVLTQLDGNTRSLLWATLQLASGREILVLVAHLDYRNDTSRIRQAKVIIKMLKNESSPVILLGDLNATPDSKPLLILKHFFTDADVPHYPTFPSNKPSEQIDYILTDKQHFQRISGKVYHVTYSDHCPIFASIKLSL
jgi:endonuclease/exonuclease/phosphatase family metal-dependent hydrolase